MLIYILLILLIILEYIQGLENPFIHKIMINNNTNYVSKLKIEISNVLDVYVSK